ncbi:hypothetical protein WA158_008173 [Blastocystis sp. Blastoise]
MTDIPLKDEKVVCEAFDFCGIPVSLQVKNHFKHLCDLERNKLEDHGAVVRLADSVNNVKSSLSLLEENNKSIKSSISSLEDHLKLVSSSLGEIDTTLDLLKGKISYIEYESLLTGKESLTSSKKREIWKQLSDDPIFHSNKILYLFQPDSTILTYMDRAFFFMLFKDCCQWQLLYRMSDHEGSVKCFKEKCWEKESLVFVKALDDDKNIVTFEGYTATGWGKNLIDRDNPPRPGMGWRADKNAFLFSLINPHGYNYSLLRLDKENVTSIACALNSNDPLFPLSFCQGFMLSDAQKGGKFSVGIVNSLNNPDPVYISPHPELGNSFFTNNGKPDEANIFALVDFEVYTDLNTPKRSDEPQTCDHGL